MEQQQDLVRGAVVAGRALVADLRAQPVDGNVDGFADGPLEVLDDSLAVLLEQRRHGHDRQVGHVPGIARRVAPLVLAGVKQETHVLAVGEAVDGVEDGVGLGPGRVLDDHEGVAVGGVDGHDQVVDRIERAATALLAVQHRPLVGVVPLAGHPLADGALARSRRPDDHAVLPGRQVGDERLRHPPVSGGSVVTACQRPLDGVAGVDLGEGETDAPRGRGIGHRFLPEVRHVQPDEPLPLQRDRQVVADGRQGEATVDVDCSRAAVGVGQQRVGSLVGVGPDPLVEVLSPPDRGRRVVHEHAVDAAALVEDDHDDGRPRGVPIAVVEQAERERRDVADEDVEPVGFGHGGRPPRELLAQRPEQRRRNDHLRGPTGGDDVLVEEPDVPGVVQCRKHGPVPPRVGQGPVEPFERTVRRRIGGEQRLAAGDRLRLDGRIDRERIDDGLGVDDVFQFRLERPEAVQRQASRDGSCDPVVPAFDEVRVLEFAYRPVDRRPGVLHLVDEVPLVRGVLTETPQDPRPTREDVERPGISGLIGHWPPLSTPRLNFVPSFQSCELVEITGRDADSSGTCPGRDRRRRGPSTTTNWTSVAAGVRRSFRETTRRYLIG